MELHTQLPWIAGPAEKTGGSWDWQRELEVWWAARRVGRRAVNPVNLGCVSRGGRKCSTRSMAMIGSMGGKFHLPKKKGRLYR